MLERLSKMIVDVKSIKNVEDDDKIIVINGWSDEIVDELIAQEHDRKINIHNLAKYLEIVEENKNIFYELDNKLYEKYNKHFQLEMLKEIALQLLFRKCSIEEVEEILLRYKEL